MSEFVVVFCTVPDEEVGVKIARRLVENRLAACCNLVRGLRSIYVWKGEVCDEPELLLLIKTTRKALPPLEQEIVSLHPYEVPEIIALPVEHGHQPYLNWIEEHVSR